VEALRPAQCQERWERAGAGPPDGRRLVARAGLARFGVIAAPACQLKITTPFRSRRGLPLSGQREGLGNQAEAGAVASRAGQPGQRSAPLPGAMAAPATCPRTGMPGRRWRSRSTCSRLKRWLGRGSLDSRGIVAVKETAEARPALLQGAAEAASG